MNPRLMCAIAQGFRPATVLAVAALAFTLAGPGLFAADSSGKSKTRFGEAPGKEEEFAGGVSFENKAQYSVTSGSRTRSGSTRVGHVSSQSAAAESVMSLHLDEDILLRAGVGWERHSFGLAGHVPLPKELQSANLIIGADVDISDQWLMRMEIQPGVYGDWLNVGFDDLNSPLIIGFSWLPDKDLQWFFGIYVNPRADVPVFPGMGLRWKFADRWTLMALPPNPRIEFDLTENLTLFGGANLHYGTYHVNNVHGVVRSHNLDDNMVDYTEIRGGLGLKWKVARSVDLQLQGGSMLYREFDFHRHDTKFRGKPSLYGEFGIVANF
ncbi:MAG: hypothetical protein HZA91_00685 [Verrucomicrobia bacterium]|nr:hypothetical protein [Verrucomicrobiota bacterium]